MSAVMNPELDEGISLRDLAKEFPLLPEEAERLLDSISLYQED